MAEIISSNSLILRVYVGEASQGDNKYSLSTTVAGDPIVESEQTGKYYCLRWQDIIEMAIEAGIDNPEVDLEGDDNDQG